MSASASQRCLTRERTARNAENVLQNAVDSEKAAMSTKLAMSGHFLHSCQPRLDSNASHSPAVAVTEKTKHERAERSEQQSQRDAERHGAYGLAEERGET